MAGARKIKTVYKPLCGHRLVCIFITPTHRKIGQYGFITDLYMHLIVFGSWRLLLGDLCRPVLVHNEYAIAV